MVTVSDAKEANLLSTLGLTAPTSLADLEWQFYSANSGLTPVTKFTLIDHKLAFYKLNGALGASIVEVERSYFSLSGAVGNTYDDLALDFYKNSGFGPKSISGLALWLDSGNVDGSNNAGLVDGQAVSQWNDISGNARHVSQATGTKQPLFRSANPNLLTYNQSTAEVDASGWANNVNGTVASSSTKSFQGAKSIALSPTALGANSCITPVATPVTVGLQYTAQCRIQGAATALARSCNISIQWLNGGGGVISNSTSANANDNTATWITYSVTGTAPAGAVTAKLIVNNLDGTTPIGEIHFIDGIDFRQAAAIASFLPPVTLPSTGKPAIQFDGVDDLLQWTGASLDSTATITVFVVANASAITTGAARLLSLWNSINDSASSDSFDISPLTTFAGGIRLERNGVANAGAAFTPDTIEVWEVVYDGVNPGVLYRNGVSYVTNATSATSVLNILHVTVGNGYNGGESWNGGILAQLVYNRALSTSERQRVERYLKNRFGTP